MPTSSTTISRLLLDHPDLGHDGGSSLHTKIAAIYTKIGDGMSSRFYTSDALADASSVDFVHNFKTAFGELRVNLYNRDTGTGELTRITAGGSPDLNDFTIVGTPSFETTRLRITNNTGSAQDIAAVVTHGKGAEIINDLSDVDTVTVPPENGQALVWDGSNFVPGASGDASFKIQSVTSAGVTVIKGGYLIDDKGRELATYDGAGSASTDFGVDISIDLDNLVTSPVNDTTYYIYVDDSALSAAVTTSDTGRKLLAVAEAQLKAFTTAPDAVNLVRYTPIGFVRYATAVWSTTIFGSTAFRRHDDPSVVVSPVAYTLSKQAVGAIGSVGQIRAGHVLDVNSFPAISSTLFSFWNLAANGNDGSNGKTLTNNGSAVFTATNINGLATSALTLDGTDDYFSVTDAFFSVADVDFSFGGWFNATDWTPAGQQVLMSTSPTSGDLGQRILVNTAGTFELQARVGGTFERYTTANPGFTNATWHHIAYRYVAASNAMQLFIDGALFASFILTAPNEAAAAPVMTIGAQYTTGTALFFAGSVEDCFFVKSGLQDLEIAKLASYRLDHNRTVNIANQLWTFNHYAATSNLASHLWGQVLDMKTNSVYLAFNDADPADSIEGKLTDSGATASTVPVVTFDRIFTSDPDIDITPIDTYLADDPTSIEVLKFSAGKWSVVADGNSLIDVANTGNRAMSGDLATTTPSVSEPVRVVISSAPAATAITYSRVNVKGISEIQWAGKTKFVGGTHPDAYATLALALAASSAGDSILVMSGYSITAEEVVSVNNVNIEFMPNVTITATAAIATGMLSINATGVRVSGGTFVANFAGTLNAFVYFTASALDCTVERQICEANNAGLTVTQAIHAIASSARNDGRMSKKATLGTITSALTDAGTDNDITVRG